MVVVGYASEDDCANQYVMHTLCHRDGHVNSLGDMATGDYLF